MVVVAVGKEDHVYILRVEPHLPHVIENWLT